MAFLYYYSKGYSQMKQEVIVINGIPKIREILSHERCHHLTASVPKDKVKDTSCVWKVTFSAYVITSHIYLSLFLVRMFTFYSLSKF